MNLDDIKIKESIFRAYDIRGIYGDDLTKEVAFIVGKSIGSEVLEKGGKAINVGADGRKSSPILVEGLIDGLLSTGLTVYDLGLIPTPVCYFANYNLQATSSVMLTGSHNPPDYNGFKIVIENDALANEQIYALYQRIVDKNLLNGQGLLVKHNILDVYKNYILNNIKLARPLKVVVDYGNGATGIIAPEIFANLDIELTNLYAEIDGNFPNHHPDPSRVENLTDLIKEVQTQNADIGLAFDGDGDRVGIITKKGVFIEADKLLAIFAKDLLSRSKDVTVIYDVKCSRIVPQTIAENGGKPLMWKTGHSLIKKKMKEVDASLAGEMSGHIFFKERFFGYDDGIYAACRMLEIVSKSNLDLDAMLAEFKKQFSTPEINIKVGDEAKFAIIEKLQEMEWGENANISTMDGVRVDTNLGFGLVRASNTTPIIVLRFEADNNEELNKLQALFKKNLLSVDKNIQLPF